MSNFQYWKDEIADMPEKDENGDWYDLETGLRYDPSAHYKTGGKITRWQPRDDVKEHRKIAKFYGGKALKGSIKQKVWAESIRASVLTSEELSDEEKVALIGLGSLLETAKFWINNKDVATKHFKREIILAEDKALGELYSKHYDTLARSGPTYPKEEAAKEIYALLKSQIFNVNFTFPNLDFYTLFGELKEMKLQNNRLVEVSTTKRR